MSRACKKAFRVVKNVWKRDFSAMRFDKGVKRWRSSAHRLTLGPATKFRCGGKSFHWSITQTEIFWLVVSGVSCNRQSGFQAGSSPRGWYFPKAVMSWWNSIRSAEIADEISMATDTIPLYSGSKMLYQPIIQFLQKYKPSYSKKQKPHQHRQWHIPARHILSLTPTLTKWAFHTVNSN